MKWRGILLAAAEEIVDRGILRPFWPMFVTGLCSLPAVFLGLWLRWDWLVMAGFVGGYGVVAWGLAALLFVFLFVFGLSPWIDVERPGPTVSQSGAATVPKSAAVRPGSTKGGRVTSASDGSRV